MYSHIIKNDWKNLIADRSVWLALIGFTLLLSYGIYNGGKWARAQSLVNETVIAEQEKRYVENRVRVASSQTATPDPSDSFAVGAALGYAVLPPSPLGFTSIGQSDLLRSKIGVSVLSKQGTKEDKQGFENPLSLLAGRFDLAFVIVYLLPLLVLTLSFNLISSERENGTLQMILSQPVSLARFGMAKLFHRVLIVSVLIGSVSVLGMLLTSDSLNSREFWLSVLLWLLAVLLYTLFWFGLALLVNSFGRSSAANAVVLGGCWIAFVLVLPSLVNAMVTSIYPMPSRVDEINEIRSVNLDIRRDGTRLLNEFYQDHPELAPRNDVSDRAFMLKYLTIQQELKRRLATVEDRFNAQLEQQQRTVDRAGFVSPAISMQESLNQIAGTDTSRYQLFRTQARVYAEAWDAKFLPPIYRNVKLAPADYDQIPRFTFHDRSFVMLAISVAKALAGILLPIILLLGWSKYRLSKGGLLDHDASFALFGIAGAKRTRLAKT
jgi:ABC-2 type transport system permease protein